MSEELNEKALLAEFKRVMKPSEFDFLDQQYWIAEAKWVYGRGIGKYLSIGAHRTQSGEVEFIKLAPLFKSGKVDCYKEVVIFRNLLLELDLDDKRGDDANSREQAVITAKALIDHYNITQEELYPQQWIACSDRMPEEEQEVMIGWQQNNGNFEAAMVFHSFVEGRWLDSLDGDESPPPTHYLPIPTL